MIFHGHYQERNFSGKTGGTEALDLSMGTCYY